MPEVPSEGMAMDSGTRRWNTCLLFKYVVNILSSTTRVIRNGVYKGIFLIGAVLYCFEPEKKVMTKSFVSVKYMIIDDRFFI